MESVEERVIAVTARVLGIEPGEIDPGNDFTTDLGAESVQSVELALKALGGQKVDRFSKVTPAIIDKPMLDKGTDPEIGYLR